MCKTILNFLHSTQYMKEFTFDTSNMSNITLYMAANTTFDTSDMSNIECIHVYCVQNFQHLSQYNMDKSKSIWVLVTETFIEIHNVQNV